MTTRGGVSSSPSSALLRRSTDRSMAPMRSSRQFTVTSRSARSISTPSSMTWRTSTAARFRSSGGTWRSSQICAATRSSCWPGRMSHAYNAWSARARALVSTFARTQPFEKIHHLERGECRIPSLVSVCATGARLGLLERIRREQPEADRHIEVRTRIGDPARRLASDEVEVRRLAANHGAEHDERMVALGGEQGASGCRKLPRARHPHDIDVLARPAMPGERINRAVHQLLRDACLLYTSDAA